MMFCSFKFVDKNYNKLGDKNIIISMFYDVFLQLVCEWAISIKWNANCY